MADVYLTPKVVKGFIPVAHFNPGSNTNLKYTDEKGVQHNLNINNLRILVMTNNDYANADNEQVCYGRLRKISLAKLKEFYNNKV